MCFHTKKTQQAVLRFACRHHIGQMSDVWKALKIEETTGSKKKTNNLNKYKKTLTFSVVLRLILIITKNSSTQAKFLAPYTVVQHSESKKW